MNYKDYIALTKPRITFLVSFTTLLGLWVGSHGHPVIINILLTVFVVMLASGGSSVINNWYDRDIDARMVRTKNRPLPAKRVQPRPALIFGIILSLLSSVISIIFINPMTTLLTVLAILT